MVVAEYTGRPATAEQFYENVRRLLMYYNAKLLYENEKRGLHTYFAQKHCEWMLADQPNELIKDITQNSKVERGKGIHMNKYVKQYMEGLIKEWLEEEYKPGVRQLTKILSEPLIEELIAYDGEKNTDRVVAFGLCLMYREQLFHVKVKEKTDESKYVQLFESPMFSNFSMYNPNKFRLDF